MRGRKPTPRNLRVIKGTQRPDRINEDEPKVPVSIPSPPEHLSTDEADVFIVTARKLARMRVMTDADVDALSIYAVLFIRWREAVARVREQGMMVRSPNGHPIQNPYLSIANKAQSEMLKILSEFGLTPSSRTRVKVT